MNDSRLHLESYTERSQASRSAEKLASSSLRDLLVTTGEMNSPQLFEMLLAFFESSPNALFIKDRDGKYLLCNSTVAHMVGKPISAILGKDDREFFDEESAALVMSRDLRVVELGLAEVAEEVLVSSGQTMIYEAIKAPYTNADGDTMGVLGISRDVTMSRKAEEALHQSHRLLRSVIDALPVGVQIMDLKGDIVTTNPAAERIWGGITGPGHQRYATTKGRWYHSGEPLKPTDWASSRALARGEVAHNEMIDIQARDGVKRTILNSSAPIKDERGIILGAVVVNEDITERLRIEKQFLHAQKMEAIGQLAAGTAHDFNNLLSVIRGNGDLLYDDLASDAPRRELVAEILGAVKRAAALTKQLLAFSRKSVVDSQVVDLNDLVRTSRPLLDRILNEAVVSTIELDDSPCIVKLDPVQFEQLLSSLCANALDAMPGGGTLSVRTSHSEAADGFVAVIVTDSGRGMAPEIQEQVFEPFFTTKVEGRASGLGLAAVYGIMRQCGGEAEVESRPGAGTSFKLSFPLVSVSKRRNAPAAIDFTSKGESILVVDDQHAVRRVLAKALERVGYVVEQASDGTEALRLWKQKGDRFDLVITDIVMPRMSGRQLGERLKSVNPEVKLLYMSGHTTDVALLEGVSPSETAWLQKPFSLELLTRKVREILDDSSP